MGASEEVADASQARAAGRPRDATKDAAILEAALELFVEEGVEGASFEKIARRAGTTRPAIYRRYASKEHLIASAIGHWRETWERRFAPWQTMSVDEAVAALTSPEVARITANPLALRLFARLIGSIPDHPELMATYWRHYLAPRREALGRILSEARDKGMVRSGADIDILRDMVMGALMSRLLLQPAPSEEEMQDYFGRLLREIGLPTS